MRRRRAASALALFALLSLSASASSVRAQETVLTFEGEVDAGDELRYFAIDFEVPAGTAEIEVRHDDLSAENILDWGLLGPGGAFRGYGGGNPEPAITNEFGASRSYLTGPIEAGTWQVYVGEAKLVELPARYSVTVILREAPTFPAQPERAPFVPPAALEVGPRWYAGDFHVHSRESGDSGATFEEILALARERGLDFVELSEHNTTSQLDYLVELQRAAPDVLFFPGVEVTTYLGHGNAIGLTRWVDHRLGLEGPGGPRSMTDVVQEALAAGALFAPNHPELRVGDLCIGCGWDEEVDPSLLSAVELQTGDAAGAAGILLTPTLRRWEAWIAEGHHVAAIGGSDDHTAGRGGGPFASPIGTPATMVWAEELSVEALMAGVAAGRTVVILEGPSGPMAELDVTEPGLRDGSEVVADQPTLRVRVTRAREGMSLQLLKNSRVIRREAIVGSGGATPFELTLPIAAPAEGEDAWRAEVVSGTTRYTITSHLYIRAATPGWVPPMDAGPPPDAGAPPPEESGGCGCRAAPQREGHPWALLLGLAAIVIVLREKYESI